MMDLNEQSAAQPSAPAPSSILRRTTSKDTVTTTTSTPPTPTASATTSTAATTSNSSNSDPPRRKSLKDGVQNVILGIVKLNKSFRDLNFDDGPNDNDKRNSSCSNLNNNNSSSNLKFKSSNSNSKNNSSNNRLGAEQTPAPYHYYRTQSNEELIDAAAKESQKKVNRPRSRPRSRSSDKILGPDQQQQQQQPGTTSTTTTTSTPTKDRVKPRRVKTSDLHEFMFSSSNNPNNGASKASPADLSDLPTLDANGRPLKIKVRRAKQRSMYPNANDNTNNNNNNNNNTTISAPATTNRRTGGSLDANADLFARFNRSCGRLSDYDLESDDADDFLMERNHRKTASNTSATHAATGKLLSPVSPREVAKLSPHPPTSTTATKTSSPTVAAAATTTRLTSSAKTPTGAGLHRSPLRSDKPRVGGSSGACVMEARHADTSKTPVRRKGAQRHHSTDEGIMSLMRSGTSLYNDGGGERERESNNNGGGGEKGVENERIGTSILRAVVAAASPLVSTTNDGSAKKDELDEMLWKERPENVNRMAILQRRANIKKDRDDRKNRRSMGADVVLDDGADGLFKGGGVGESKKATKSSRTPVGRTKSNNFRL